MIPQSPSRRKGFTVVELLAVAGCISVLTALLLPSIQDARSAALRSQCQNNLKYIGLSLHNYHDVYNAFPPGWVSRYRDGESEAGFGWQAKLLPYLEQTTLYEKLNMNDPMTEPEGLLTESVKLYLCPEDTEAPKQNPFRGGYGTSSYSGLMGTRAPHRWSDGRMESFWPGAVATFASGQYGQGEPKETRPKQPMKMSDSLQATPDGIFGWNSNVGMRHLTDGTSNTMMVSERSSISGWGIWAGVGANRFENDVVTDVSYQSPLNQSLTGFSSAHTEGMFVCIADGSVKFMSSAIDSNSEGGVLQFLGTRSGGEVISGDPFSP